MSQLQLEGVTKRYSHTIVAVNDITLHIDAGELIALLGPSGCGKTTLLRLIAGLEQPDAGAIFFQGENLADRPVHERGFGLMFQDFALFPHRTVADNIAFGLRMAGRSKAETTQRVVEMLELVNLEGYGQRSVQQLSGGERQRVALARSLAPRPQLLMLDEPLGSLDRSLRDQLMDEIRIILAESNVTAIYVTHDQEEAFTVADRVIVMNQGKIVQDGAPTAVYGHPQNLFVARFLGFKNLLPAYISSSAPHMVNTPIGRITNLRAAATMSPGEYVLLVRPDGAYLKPEVASAGSPGFCCSQVTDSSGHEAIRLVGQLTQKWYHGDHHRIELAIATAREDVNAQRSTTSEMPLEWNQNDHLQLQFDLMLLQPVAEDIQHLSLQLPAVGSLLALQLHPGQLVLLPKS